MNVFCCPTCDAAIAVASDRARTPRADFCCRNGHGPAAPVVRALPGHEPGALEVVDWIHAHPAASGAEFAAQFPPRTPADAAAPAIPAGGELLARAMREARGATS